MPTQTDLLPFAELHCLSNFSFLRGASHPEELVAQASALGYNAIAITDECSVAGVVRAWQYRREHELSIKLIVGSEFRLDELYFVLLAPTRQAWSQLCRLITQARRRARKGEYELLSSDLNPQALSECLLLWYPVGDAHIDAAGYERLQQACPERLWVANSRHLAPNEEDLYRYRQSMAQQLKLPEVCTNQVHMHVPERQRLQDTLTAIRHGCTLQTAGYRLFINAERHLRSRQSLHQLYDAAAIAQTQAIANRCVFELSELRYEYPAEIVPKGLTPARYLQQLTREGERRRYPEGTPLKVQRDIAKELNLIIELRYEHFFLTIEDIVRFARSQGILCQGRGSAANSAVCFCLGITEVDPAQVTLLFERFISRERNEPPDIDVDFEHERREEVIQYIYQKYGRHRAALAATVISYRSKSAIRDVGKALGFDVPEMDRLIRQLDRRDKDNPWIEQLRQLPEPIGKSSALLTQRFIELVAEIQRFPRHLSQHVGGFVIAADHLNNWVPTENAAMAERTVIQWDKDDLESLGLLKVDVLALGMLSAIRKSFRMIQDFYGREYSLATVPKNDPDTYRMLQKGDSVGVFQVESRAQINMLPRLKPKNYYDLVIQVSIVRPGPIQGDMVHPYLRRRDGLEAVDYPSPAIKKVLERTLGVPIFQEQVIALAMAAAGFSAGEADQLRRAMASWKKHGHMEKLQARLVDGMRERGHDEEFIQRICRQIQGFGEYGFPESHAASFALLVYVSSWLKCHEPAIFCCALLNSQPMGFYSPSQLIQDAQRHDVEILPVDVNNSIWDHQIVPASNSAPTKPEPAIRLGLRLIKGLSSEAAQQILAQRPAAGYGSLTELQNTVTLSQRDWQALASAGAFRSLSGHRYQARWDTLGRVPATPLFTADLFAEQPVTLAAPSEGDNILEDYSSLGLTLERHPLALLREQGQLHPKALTAEQLHEMSPHKQAVVVCGLVTGRQRPGTSSGVTFVTLEDETGNTNVVVWLNTARRQRKALLTAHLLQVNGVLEKEGDVVHVVANHLIDQSELLAALRIRSRDFH
ncbi:error-prone DNA polymerase [Salinispirillum sp. LH 10-3-1]|uniref:Error-prone DNA polymerase n=1 Tax=Salinispirillum sp. LH 10-3-1 TaxID=2952525 RepID=A0AB38YBV1_9GAMM